MSDAYIIEVRGETAGIVARDGRSFRFYASNNRYNHLEGKAFASPRDAEKAAQDLALTRGKPRNHVYTVDFDPLLRLAS